MQAKDIIQLLDLQAHPEGGYYKEIYRSADQISPTALPFGYTAERAAYTSIYFMLGKADKSHYHRLLSDEIWYFHSGTTIKVYILHAQHGLITHEMGPLPQLQQLLLPKNSWFAAEVTGKQADYALVSCMVAPGFHFDDFELAQYEQLVAEFPAYADHLKAFTQS